MKKSLWIAILIIIMALILLFIILNNQATEQKEAQDRTQQLESYSNIQTSEDVFNQIEESIKFIE